MITKLTINNFKKLERLEIPLDRTVLFIGPNNCGKTSALQALALWEIGMRRFAERSKSRAKKRLGVQIHRTEILAIPLPAINQLWFELNVRKSVQLKSKKYQPQNILIEITVEGFTENINWELGLEFYYANPDALYCRQSGESPEFPDVALSEHIGFLPPMSGLASEEDLMQKGSIDVRIGQGRTAEVLRNLCWIIWDQKREKWDELTEKMNGLFGILLNAPQYNQATGRITMSYSESKKIKMDLANVGRGFQQVLLLFAYIYVNQNTILMLDEPDAHLEIVRQRTIYRSLTELVREEQSQLIVATHSEAILNEAAEQDQIIAFLGTPHVVNDRSQLVKSLATIGFEQYLLAEEKEWVLYLEGSTDLSILKAFAEVLRHPVREALKNPFVKYVSDNPSEARKFFYGLKEWSPKLRGIALFDRIDRKLQSEDLRELMWQRREIENYIPIQRVAEQYIENQQSDSFKQHDPAAIRKLLSDYIPPAALNDTTEEWWQTAKMSDDVLDKAFKKYYKERNMPVEMRKGNYHELARLARPEELDDEITKKLDAIYAVANNQ